MADVANITIRHVRAALEAGKNTMLGPLYVFAPNFFSYRPFPQKFTFLGCSRRLQNGRLCGKTVEGPYQCDHQSLDSGAWLDTYRFDLVLVDASISKDNPPLRATIFDAARGLLMMSAANFCLKTEEVQVTTVQNAIELMPYLEVWLKVFENGVTVEHLAKVPGDEVVPAAEDVAAMSRGGIGSSAKQNSFTTPSRATPSPNTRFGTPKFDPNNVHGPAKGKDSKLVDLKKRVQEINSLISELEL